MRSRFVGPFVALVVGLGLAPALFAQTGQQAAAKKTPAANTKPFDAHDISGIWANPGGFDAVLGNSRPPMTDWGKAKWATTKASGRKTPLSYGFFPDQKDWNDPLFLCDPSGYPRNLDYGNYRFVQVPGEVLEFFERDPMWRDLWLDGRKLPVDAELRWYGYSIAHWDADTLVVESSGFDDRTWIDPYGSIHSDQMTLEERYKRLDHDHLDMTMTLTDPKTYTAPWVGVHKALKTMITSDRVQPGAWGYKADGTEYGDIRPDYCVYSDEHGFWKTLDPTGDKGKFENLPAASGPDRQ
jgi:hypothetical protein